jgi:delta-aminolevulinic acid dehydratase/porphobilinogen synthase
VKEGADMIMVKPGYPYLDIVRDASDLVRCPQIFYSVNRILSNFLIGQWASIAVF